MNLRHPLQLDAASTVSRIDRLTSTVGAWLQWAALASIALAAFAAVSRKLFGFYSNSWSELQWYLFGAVFLLGAADVLRADEHVRVDVLWTRWSPRTKAWIDTLVLLLVALPTCITMLVLGAMHTWAAVRLGEHSYMADGLLIWPVRALVPLGFGLLALQVVAEVIRRWPLLGSGHASPADGAAPAEPPRA